MFQKLPFFVRIWLYEYIKKFATIQGRANRSQYWWSTLCVFVIGLVLNLLSLIPFAGVLFAVMSYVFSIACFIPGITLTARRLHDIGLSALWILWYFIGWFGIALIGVLFIAFSTHRLVGFLYIGVIILALGYIASIVLWLVAMARPGQEGANKFGEPAEVKELTSLSVSAE